MSYIQDLKNDYDWLLKQWQILLWWIYKQLFKNSLPDNFYEIFESCTKEEIDSCIFRVDYQSRYHHVSLYVKEFWPERLKEFNEFYDTNKNRKELNFLNYTIKDYILWYSTNIISYERFVSTVYNKYEQQYSIFKNIWESIDSKIVNIRDLIHADLLESQIDEAKVLLKNWYQRASWAICWVIIEEHLQKVSSNSWLKLSKKDPWIWDLNQGLYDSKIIDLLTFKEISIAGTLRNLCDHKKTVEPTKDNIKQLIEKTEWILKNVQ